MYLKIVMFFTKEECFLRQVKRPVLLLILCGLLSIKKHVNFGKINERVINVFLFLPKES